MVDHAYTRPSRPSLARIGIPDEVDDLAIQLREQRQAQSSRDEAGLGASSTSTLSVAASDTQRIMLPAPMMPFGIVTNNAPELLLHVGARFNEEPSGRGAYVAELDILGSSHGQ